METVYRPMQLNAYGLQPNTYSFSDTMTMHCGPTGSIQMVINGGKKPYTVHISNASFDTTVVNPTNYSNYLGYYSTYFGGLAKGTYKISVVDSCGETRFVHPDITINEDRDITNSVLTAATYSIYRDNYNCNNSFDIVPGACSFSNGINYHYHPQVEHQIEVDGLVIKPWSNFVKNKKFDFLNGQHFYNSFSLTSIPADGKIMVKTRKRCDPSNVVTSSISLPISIPTTWVPNFTIANNMCDSHIVSMDFNPFVNICLPATIEVKKHGGSVQTEIIDTLLSFSGTYQSLFYPFKNKYTAGTYDFKITDTKLQTSSLSNYVVSGTHHALRINTRDNCTGDSILLLLNADSSSLYMSPPHYYVRPGAIGSFPVTVSVLQAPAGEVLPTLTFATEDDYTRHIGQLGGVYTVKRPGNYQIKVDATGCVSTSMLTNVQLQISSLKFVNVQAKRICSQVSIETEIAITSSLPMQYAQYTINTSWLVNQNIENVFAPASFAVICTEAPYNLALGYTYTMGGGMPVNLTGGKAKWVSPFSNYPAGRYKVALSRYFERNTGPPAMLITPCSSTPLDTISFIVPEYNNLRVSPYGSGGAVCNGLGSLVLNAIGEGDLEYRYKKKGDPDANYSAAQASNTFSGLAPGEYTLTVSDSCGSVVKQDLKLRNTAVEGVLQVLGADACVGSKFIARVLPVGPVNAYRWKRDGNALPNTTDTLVFNALAVGDNGEYTVEVDLTTGCTIRDTVTVAVKQIMPTPTITGANSICDGGTTLLSTTQVAGAQYTWQHNGLTIAGANLSNLAASMVGTYTVSAAKTGFCSAVFSVPHTLTLTSNCLEAVDDRFFAFECDSIRLDPTVNDPNLAGYTLTLATSNPAATLGTATAHSNNTIKYDAFCHVGGKTDTLGYTIASGAQQSQALIMVHVMKQPNIVLLDSCSFAPKMTLDLQYQGTYQWQFYNETLHLWENIPYTGVTCTQLQAGSYRVKISHAKGPQTITPARKLTVSKKIKIANRDWYQVGFQ